ncbi:hypothetical protein [Plantibacter sp. YIM 135249]|uniref:hypothetical protein n=1 Tax=Plantibacter sp. YIM 135249 TaxID=3423918 RepID=UPI003D330CCF
MDALQVDERDSTWEQHESVFRVYFGTVPPADESGFAIDTVDVTGATFSEALAWAEETAADDVVVAIALVGFDRAGLKGLTWLIGMDPNDGWGDDLERRMVAELHTRRATRLA